MINANCLVPMKKDWINAGSNSLQPFLDIINNINMSIKINDVCSVPVKEDRVNASSNSLQLSLDTIISNRFPSLCESFEYRWKGKRKQSSLANLPMPLKEDLNDTGLISNSTSLPPVPRKPPPSQIPRSSRKHLRWFEHLPQNPLYPLLLFPPRSLNVASVTFSIPAWTITDASPASKMWNGRRVVHIKPNPEYRSAWKNRRLKTRLSPLAKPPFSSPEQSIVWAEPVSSPALSRYDTQPVASCLSDEEDPDSASPSSLLRLRRQFRRLKGESDVSSSAPSTPSEPAPLLKTPSPRAPSRKTLLEFVRGRPKSPSLVSRQLSPVALGLTPSASVSSLAICSARRLYDHRKEQMPVEDALRVIEDVYDTPFFNPSLNRMPSHWSPGQFKVDPSRRSSISWDTGDSSGGPVSDHEYDSPPVVRMSLGDQDLMERVMAALPKGPLHSKLLEQLCRKGFPISGEAESSISSSVARRRSSSWEMVDEKPWTEHEGLVINGFLQDDFDGITNRAGFRAYIRALVQDGDANYEPYQPPRPVVSPISWSSPSCISPAPSVASLTVEPAQTPRSPGSPARWSSPFRPLPPITPPVPPLWLLQEYSASPGTQKSMHLTPFDAAPPAPESPAFPTPAPRRSFSDPELPPTEAVRRVIRFPPPRRPHAGSAPPVPEALRPAKTKSHAPLQTPYRIRAGARAERRSRTRPRRRHAGPAKACAALSLVTAVVSAAAFAGHLAYTWWCG
ncbi:hypothetical protein F5Y15DRAFT_413769 [Xylariaceae sp. FL0016]|nr:hypothetical protein F5Y15DRAFT_413769 [Xylariaceae sp. FL0016]